MHMPTRRPQVCVLGSAEPGSRAYELAAAAGTLLAQYGITLVSGCGSPATRVAAERAIGAGGLVLSVLPADTMPAADWPATVVVPCGMGDARNLIMALAGDACIVVGGRAGTISEVCLAWLHKRPLLPLVGAGGWSDGLPAHPPDERQNSPLLPWSSVAELESQLRALGLVQTAEAGRRKAPRAAPVERRAADAEAVPAGYSGTPLFKKLGIQAPMSLVVLDAPPEYEALVGALPDGVQRGRVAGRNTDMVHVFATRRTALAQRLGQLRRKLGDESAVWVSWPKKASKVDTDITEDTIRELGLPLGFVDVKVCAVSDVWSGLKLVVRKSRRGDGAA